MVVQDFFKAIWKSFSMTLPNSSHALVFAFATALAALRLACRHLYAASEVLQAKKARYDSFFSMMALSAGVHQKVKILPPRQAPTTLQNGCTKHGPLGLNVPPLNPLFTQVSRTCDCKSDNTGHATANPTTQSRSPA